MTTTQGVRQDTLNSTRSSNFVRFMLAHRANRSGALHKIAFKRNLFPAGSFSPSDRFNGAEELKATGDPVARRLLDQLGKGVFAAIKAKYARTITYYVVHPDSSESDDERVIEEYAFTIRYGEDDFETRVDELAVRGATAKKRTTEKKNDGSVVSPLDDEEKIKDAGDQMLRQLECLIDNLDPVPEGSRIGIRLTYVESTPAEYEPPFFEACDSPSCAVSDALEDSQRERHDCGSVQTRFHAMSLQWRVRDVSGDRDLQERRGGAAKEAEKKPAEDDEKENETVLEKNPSFPKSSVEKNALSPRVSPGPSFSGGQDFPFESQPEPEPGPVFRERNEKKETSTMECRNYHYLSQSEPQFDSESQGFDAPQARAPFSRAGGGTASLTGSIGVTLSLSQRERNGEPKSRAPSSSSPFWTVGSGFKGGGGSRKAGDSAAAGSFSFGGGGGSLGGGSLGGGSNLSHDRRGNGSLGGGFSFGARLENTTTGGFGLRVGFGSPIRSPVSQKSPLADPTAAAASAEGHRRRAGFLTPPSTPWRKRLRSVN